MGKPFTVVLKSRDPRKTIEIISVFSVGEFTWCAWVRVGGKSYEIREIDGVFLMDTFAWVAASRQFAAGGRR